MCAPGPRSRGRMAVNAPDRGGLTNERRADFCRRHLRFVGGIVLCLDRHDDFRVLEWAVGAAIDDVQSSLPVFPTFGLLVLAGFYLPSVIFTDLYWHHATYGRVRFALGFVAAIGSASGSIHCCRRRRPGSGSCRRAHWRSIGANRRIAQARGNAGGRASRMRCTTSVMKRASGRDCRCLRAIAGRIR